MNYREGGREGGEGEISVREVRKREKEMGERKYEREEMDIWTGERWRGRGLPTIPINRSPRRESCFHDDSLECRSARKPLLKARMSSTLAKMRPLSSPNTAASGSLKTW